MDWINDLPAGVFWFGWGMVALLAAGPLAAMVWARRNSAAIGAQTPVDVKDLDEGYRLAWGHALGPAQKAPLTGRACVWWKIELWESRQTKDPDGKTMRWVWTRAMERQSDRVVIFGEGHARAAVSAYGATVLPSVWSDWRGQDLPPENRDPEAHRDGMPAQQGLERDIQGTFGPKWRYREQIIEPGAPIFALGDAQRIDKSLLEPEEDDEGAAAEMEGWEAPEEAAIARRLKLKRTTDSVLDADMRSADWVFVKAKGQPFILSTQHPGAVADQMDLGAKGGMIMGALFAALAVWAAWVRLGG